MVQPEKVIPPVLHYLSPVHCPSLSFVTWPQRHTVVTFCMKKCQHGALSALFLNRILMSWALFLYLTHCFPHSHWETWQNVSTESLGAISAWFYVHNKFAGLFSLLFKKKTKHFFWQDWFVVLYQRKKTARWGARKRREAVIDCVLVCDLFHMKHTWHSCQRFLFAHFSSLFHSVDYSTNLWCYLMFYRLCPCSGFRGCCQSCIISRQACCMLDNPHYTSLMSLQLCSPETGASWHFDNSPSSSVFTSL